MRHTLNKNFRFVLVLAIVIVLGVQVPTALAGITSYTADANLQLTGAGVTLTIVSGSQADSLTVNPSNFAVTVVGGESFTVRSSGRETLENGGGFNTTCESSYSQLIINPASTQTVTVSVGSGSPCGSSAGSRTTAAAVSAPPPPAPPPVIPLVATTTPPIIPPAPKRVKATPLVGQTLGTLVKLVCPAGKLDANHPCRAVYYYGSDGKRRPFPNEKEYFTWYKDFAAVKEVSVETLAQMPLAKPVTYRPGVKMVKFQTMNNVYAVTKDGTLRWITSEAVAAALYGADWNKKIDDINDAFYTNYTFGADVKAAADYSPAAEQSAVANVDKDMGFE